MKVYCCQLDIHWENRQANYEGARTLIRKAQPAPGSLVVLPEMFASGFSMNVPHVVEPKGEPTVEFLRAMAREFQVNMMAGFVDQPAGERPRNVSVTVDSHGTELARYAKMQPFTLGGEGDHYGAGRTVVVFPMNGWSVAPFVCYDLRFPEIFRAAVRRGANLMVVIANWPIKRIHHWTALLRARAIENQAYVVGVNRCGQDPQLPYNGQSAVVDPSGDLLVEAGDGEKVISADLDLTGLEVLRQSLPFLKDMRSD